jgi:hypothetical protein
VPRYGHDQNRRIVAEINRFLLWQVIIEFELRGIILSINVQEIRYYTHGARNFDSGCTIRAIKHEIRFDNLRAPSKTRRRCIVSSHTYTNPTPGAKHKGDPKVITKRTPLYWLVSTVD